MINRIWLSLQSCSKSQQTIFFHYLPEINFNIGLNYKWYIHENFTVRLPVNIKQVKKKLEEKVMSTNWLNDFIRKVRFDCNITKSSRCFSCLCEHDHVLFSTPMVSFFRLCSMHVCIHMRLHCQHRKPVFIFRMIIKLVCVCYALQSNTGLIRDLEVSHKWFAYMLASWYEFKVVKPWYQITDIRSYLKSNECWWEWWWTQCCCFCSLVSPPNICSDMKIENRIYQTKIESACHPYVVDLGISAYHLNCHF